MESSNQFLGTERIGKLMQKYAIPCPRVQGKLLTVVKVEVSSDASFAKVFVSSMSGIDDAKTAVKGLDSAMGYIRREVGHRLGLRKTPELKFVADDSIEHGMNIARMLDDLKEDEDAN